MSNLDTAYVLVRPELSGFEAQATRTIKQAGDKAGRQFGAGFKRALKSNIGQVTGGVLLAGGIEQTIRGVVRQVKLLSEAAKEEEARAVLLAGSLKNLGTETKIFGEALDEVIEKESRLKGFSDTELTDAFIRINRITKDTARTFHLLQVAEDLSRQSKIGVAQAALLLGRAEAGNFTGLSRRLGIVPKLTAAELKLSAEQQKRIKTARVLAAVEEQTSGVALKLSRTAVGATDRMDVAFSELREDIGAALLPTVTNLSNTVADYLGTAEHQAAVQATVNKVMRDGEEVVGGLADAMRDIRTAAEPVIKILGGIGNAAKVALTLGIALRIRRAIVGFGLLRVASATAATGIVADSTREVAALNTVGAAATRNAGLLSRMGLGGIAGRRGRGIAAGGLLAGGAIATTQGGAIGTIGTGALLGSAFGPVGAAVGAAGAAGLVGLNAFRAREQRINDEKITRVIKENALELNNETIRILDKFSSLTKDQILRLLERQLTKEVANIHDIESQRISLGQRTEGFAPSTATREAKASSDFAYRLKVAASRTREGTAEEKALYAGQLQYVNRQIERLEADTELTKWERNRLLSLYERKSGLQGDISSIEDENRQSREDAAEASQQAREDAAAARRDATLRRRGIAEQRLQLRLQQSQLTKSSDDDIKAQGALARYYTKLRNTLRSQGAITESLTAEANRQSAVGAIRDLREQDRAVLKEQREARSKELNERKERLQGIREQRLSIKVQEAELTKTNRDDIRAQRGLVRHYRQLEQRLRRQGAISKSLDARTNRLTAELAIKSIKGDKGDGGTALTAQQFFQAAGKEFEQFGSNISSAGGGILSGQQARGTFAGLALDRRNTVESTSQVIAANSKSQLTEQQKQTRLLSVIANTIGRDIDVRRPGRRGSTEATQKTRAQAAQQSLGGHGAI